MTGRKEIAERRPRPWVLQPRDLIRKETEEGSKARRIVSIRIARGGEAPKEVEKLFGGRHAKPDIRWLVETDGGTLERDELLEEWAKVLKKGLRPLGPEPGVSRASEEPPVGAGG